MYEWHEHYWFIPSLTIYMVRLNSTKHSYYGNYWIYP